MAKEPKPVKRGGYDHPYLVERRHKDFVQALREFKDAGNLPVEEVALPEIKEVTPLRKK